MHRKLNVHIGVQKYIYISLFIATIQDIVGLDGVARGVLLRFARVVGPTHTCIIPVHCLVKITFSISSLFPRDMLVCNAPLLQRRIHRSGSCNKTSRPRGDQGILLLALPQLHRSACFCSSLQFLSCSY